MKPVVDIGTSDRVRKVLHHGQQLCLRRVGVPGHVPGHGAGHRVDEAPRRTSPGFFLASVMVDAEGLVHALSAISVEELDAGIRADGVEASVPQHISPR